MPTELPWFLEGDFQNKLRTSPWWFKFMSDFGGPPDVSPRADYDYRGAYLANQSPSISPEDFRYHWGSRSPLSGALLKGPEHPTLYKELELDPILKMLRQLSMGTQ